MSIASKLSLLRTDVTNARTAITDKGGTVTVGGGSAKLADDIRTIPGTVYKGSIAVTTNAAGATLNLIQNSQVVDTHTLGAQETTYTFTEVEYGLYTVQVVHQYYITNTADVALASPSQSVSITCTPIGYITITTDQTEATLTCGSDTYTLTGSDLNHTFGPYQYNTFSVSAAKTGYVTATDTVVLDSPNESITLNLVETPTGVIVVTSEVGATVTIGSDSYTYDTTTHTFGPYQYGTYTVTASKGSQSQSVAVVLDSASVSVTVKPQLLPDGYTQLEYIATDSTTPPTTGINIGISALNSDTSFIAESKKVKFFTLSASNSRNMYGAEGSTIGILSNKLFPSTTNAVIDTFYKLKFVYTRGVGRTLYVDDILQEGVGSDYHSAYPFLLFCRGLSGSSSAEFLGTIGETTIWRDGSIVYHGYPCKRDSDNALGFYDVITKAFVTGDSSLVAGPEIIPLPTGYTQLSYITKPSDRASRAINTGLSGAIGTSNFRIDARVETGAGTDVGDLIILSSGPSGGNNNPGITASCSLLTQSYCDTPYFIVYGDTNNNAYIKGNRTSTRPAAQDAHISFIRDNDRASHQCYVTYNGTTYEPHIESGSNIDPSTAYNFYIFAQPDNEYLSYGGNYKLKWIKFTVGSNVVGYYVPAKRDSDNYVGVYDTISNQFLGASADGWVPGDPIGD